MPIFNMIYGMQPKKPRTFTISWTEQSDMSSGWTYSDDAAGLTAGSGDFDDFFGYSAVLLNTSGVETAEMTQSGGVFSGAMTTLGNITNGDNVMIKFPVRGIKMSKSGSVVTLSITEELNKDGYQYYAHSTGTLSNPGTPKDAFYLGAYIGYVSGNLKSWSGRSQTGNVRITDFCTYAKNNGSGYNIEGFYQRQYITALYMMKYGNPDSQSVVGVGYAGGAYGTTTGGTNSQTAATYGSSSSSTQVRLFGLEDRWGSMAEWTGGCCTDGNKVIYAALSGWDGTVNTSSPYESTGATQAGNGCVSAIAATNKGMFTPISIVSNSSYNTYYCDMSATSASRLPLYGSSAGGNNANGIFWQSFYPNTYYDTSDGSRLMYLNGLT